MSGMDFTIHYINSALEGFNIHIEIFYLVNMNVNITSHIYIPFWDSPLLRDLNGFTLKGVIVSSRASSSVGVVVGFSYFNINVTPYIRPINQSGDTTDQHHLPFFQWIVFFGKFFRRMYRFPPIRHWVISCRFSEFQTLGCQDSYFFSLRSSQGDDFP